MYKVLSMISPPFKGYHCPRKHNFEFHFRPKPTTLPGQKEEGEREGECPTETCEAAFGEGGQLREREEEARESANAWDKDTPDIFPRYIPRDDSNSREKKKYETGSSRPRAGGLAHTGTAEAEAVGPVARHGQRQWRARHRTPTFGPSHRPSQSTTGEGSMEIYPKVGNLTARVVLRPFVLVRMVERADFECISTSCASKLETRTQHAGAKLSGRTLWPRSSLYVPGRNRNCPNAANPHPGFSDSQFTAATSRSFWAAMRKTKETAK